MRRLSLSLMTLALAGVLLAACDPRPEEEAGVSEAESAEECPSASPPVITPSETLVKEPTSTPAVTATASPIGVEETASPDAIAETDPTPQSALPPATPGSTVAATEAAETTGGPDSASGVSPVETPPSTTPVEPVTASPACDQRPIVEQSTATRERATYTTGQGLIVFTRQVFDNERGFSVQHLWMVNIGGGNQAEIALPQGCDGIHTFDLSPSGSHVAFLCTGEPPTTSLFVLALDIDTYTLISSSVPYGNAYWSPDGTRLGYMDAREPGPYNFHTVAADGSDDRDWGDVPSGLLGGWTPDGRVIFLDMFGRCEATCPTMSIFLRLDTGERVELPDVSEVGPFSPDGRYVLGTVRLPRSPSNPSTNYPNPDFAATVIDLSNGMRQQVEFDDRNARPGRWIDDKTFLISARKIPDHPYAPIDCQEWVASVADVSQPTFVSDDCRDGHVSKDGRYVYFGRIRNLGGSLLVGDLYRLDLTDGSETLWMADALTTDMYEPPP